MLPGRRRCRRGPGPRTQVDLVSFTGSTGAGRASRLRGGRIQAGPPGARRQLRDDRPRRRRPREGRLGRGVGLIPAPGPSVHDHRPAHRRPEIVDKYTANLAEHADTCRRRPGERAGRARADHRREATRPGPRPGDLESTRARGSSRAANSRACSTGRPSWPTSHPRRRPTSRRSSARSRPSWHSTPRRGRPPGLRHRLRAVRGHPDRDAMKGLAIADRMRRSGNRPHQRPNDQRRGGQPVRRGQAAGPGARLGGAQANIDAFTQTQWVTIRGELPDYPF